MGLIILKYHNCVLKFNTVDNHPILKFRLRGQIMSWKNLEKKFNIDNFCNEKDFLLLINRLFKSFRLEISRQCKEGRRKGILLLKIIISNFSINRFWCSKWSSKNLFSFYSKRPGLLNQLPNVYNSNICSC